MNIISIKHSQLIRIILFDKHLIYNVYNLSKKIITLQNYLLRKIIFSNQIIHYINVLF